MKPPVLNFSGFGYDTAYSPALAAAKAGLPIWVRLTKGRYRDSIGRLESLNRLETYRNRFAIIIVVDEESGKVVRWVENGKFNGVQPLDYIKEARYKFVDTRKLDDFSCKLIDKIGQTIEVNQVVSVIKDNTLEIGLVTRVEKTGDYFYKVVSGGQNSKQARFYNSSEETKISYMIIDENDPFDEDGNRLFTHHGTLVISPETNGNLTMWRLLK